jgi:hypothetical protein
MGHWVSAPDRRSRPHSPLRRRSRGRLVRNCGWIAQFYLDNYYDVMMKHLARGGRPRNERLPDGSGQYAWSPVVGEAVDVAQRRSHRGGVCGQRRSFRADPRPGHSTPTYRSPLGSCHRRTTDGDTGNTAIESAFSGCSISSTRTFVPPRPSMPSAHRATAAGHECRRQGWEVIAHESANVALSAEISEADERAPSVLRST